MIKGRNEEALRNLARLHSRGNVNDLFVQGEYQEMEAKVQLEAANEGGWAMVSGSSSAAIERDIRLTWIADLQRQA